MKRIGVVRSGAVVVLMFVTAGCPTSSGPARDRDQPNGNAVGPGANNNDNNNTTSPELNMQIERGRAFYDENGCAACHCNDGRGGCELAAPAIQSATAVALDSHLRAAQPCLDPDSGDGVDLCADIENTEAHPLKLFETSDDPIADLGAFLASVTAAEPESSDSLITRGYQLYLQGGCVVCHLPSALVYRFTQISTYIRSVTHRAGRTFSSGRSPAPGSFRH